MLSVLFAVIVAAIHVYIALLEMVLWETPRALRVFRLSPQMAAETRVMAANQGLYNGFLVTAIVQGLLFSETLLVFGLVCVLVAGIFGCLTGIKPALKFQAVPAALALILWGIGL